ncbi:hypothetical protein ACIP3A_02125 [Streptomyces tricolor]|uniref:hypothetical protein n=1 Tax=Streptomyces tricolor TaxID=68277 RepID=UPI0036F14D8A
MSFARRRTAKAVATLFLSSCAALAVTATTAQDTHHAAGRSTTGTHALGATTGWQSPAPATVQDTTGWQ